MSNLALEEFLHSHNIELVRCNVGDKFVIESLQKQNLNFGGENSGHIIFSDYAKTGDGLASALQVLAYLKQTNKPSHIALNPFKLYPSEMCNITVSKKIPLEQISGLKAMLDSITKAGNRHLVRYSGTENKLRILIEGKSAKTIKTQMSELKAFLSQNLA